MIFRGQKDSIYNFTDFLAIVLDVTGIVLMSENISVIFFFTKTKESEFEY